MISLVKDNVTWSEESYSKLALAEGLHNPSPPIRDGRANKSRSKSLTCFPVTAGINSLVMVASRG